MTARLLLAVLLFSVPALTAPSQQFSRTYALLKGSTLTDDCPVCDRLAIVVPITGTFELLPAGEDPLFTHFLVRNVDFRSSDPLLPPYAVYGNGTYQVGGHLAPVHKMSLDLEITGPSGVTAAVCESDIVPTSQPWPTLKINVLQTNGTPFQLYSLDLIAAPLPYFTSIRVDASTGDVELRWDSFGTSFQVERAPSPAGPFEPVSDVMSETVFLDRKAAASNAQLFYRLQRF